jgi:hypothetical protein
VSTYAGPNSTTNIFYNSTMKSYAFNLPLALATDFDSDGDNIANFDDPEPFFVEDYVNFQAVMTNMPPELLLSWNGLANLHPPPFITNCVEFTTDLVTWMTYTNIVFTNGIPPFDTTNIAPVSILAPVLGVGGSYRVRIDPPLP